jgi:hypothetical protein
MKSITNKSLQSFSIFFQTEKGPQSFRLKPRKTVVVPETYISDQIRTMARRRLLKISNA